MAHWLVKQEPSDYPWASLVRDRVTVWTGVRNFQARNFLRTMKKGDTVLYYHSGEEKRVMGMARVERECFPDPTAKEGDWSAVEIQADKALKNPVTLAEIKADPALKRIALIRQSRLSVMPLTPAEFARIVEMAGAGEN